MKILTRTYRQAKCPSGEDITAYLRNELQAEEAREIQSHIEKCSACQKLVEKLADSLKFLKTLEKMPPVPDIVPGVMKRITSDISSGDASEHYVWQILLSRRVLYIAAGIAGIIAIIYGALHIQHKKQIEISGTRIQNISNIAKCKEDGIRWLANAQEADGHWDPARWGGKQEYTVGLTGISLLAILESKEDFSSKEACIQRACEYLLKQQHKDGRFGEVFDGTMYNHGIATVALLELYRRGNKPELENPLKSALAFIRQNQLATGGWTYLARSSEVANTAVSTWPLLALLISDSIGWKDVDHSINRAVRWLAGLIDENGQFGYEHRGSSPYGTEALTAMGAYCLLKAQKIGMKIDSHIIKKAEQKLASFKTGSSTDFYKTYFHVCVFKEIGEPMYSNMISIQNELAARIRQSGTEKGSWDPVDRWGTTGGRIYSTAMALMSL